MPDMKLIPALAAGALLLAACGEAVPSGGAAEGQGASIGASTATSGAAAPAASGTGDARLDEALTCWSLTHGAYFAHTALGQDQTGNLPRPDLTIHTTWHEHASLMASDKGMTLTAFQDAQDNAQTGGRLYTLTVEPGHAEAVQRCIDTTPAPSNRPHPEWAD